MESIQKSHQKIFVNR